ncbi:hypothetical protein [Metabacillus malikii]|uniref:Glutamate synthase domain-containing protein 2 n=1 Tax=Metabacillus malikii TaxID=1504265 RepID=A0ABT9ZC92_9BACI|nr:hypothetical protein [Metabacillus malikii]MDQ0228890.1 glutamate synthase domain-containing protein 2 [Metabacillus malikii]
MGDGRRRKFKLEDIVVITMYGTVGKITNIHEINGQFVYEVNHSDSLYYENALSLYSDYEGPLKKIEEINIEVFYRIGDIVFHEAYGTTEFQIIGICTEVWRYKDEGWEEVIYELIRIKDGEWLEAKESEIISVSNKHKESSHYKLLFNTHKHKDSQKHINKPQQVLKERYQTRKKIDQLLDSYNDYKILYEMFHDEIYKEKLELIVYKLQNYSKLDLY